MNTNNVGIHNVENFDDMAYFVSNIGNHNENRNTIEPVLLKMSANIMLKNPIKLDEFHFIYYKFNKTTNK